MIKLTKSERKRLVELSGALDTAKSELLDYVTEIRDRWQEEFDEKSERAQESDAGSIAQERIDAAEQLMDNIDQIDIDVGALS